MGLRKGQWAEVIIILFEANNVLKMLKLSLWFYHFQIQNNWTYGEVLDENAKTHPMLRPYKTFSEKVINQNNLSM